MFEIFNKTYIKIVQKLNDLIIESMKIGVYVAN